MKFNEKIITLRKKKGLSQEQLGEQLDVARQTISKWELGETTPEMDKLVKMSEIFEVSLDELIKDENMNENMRTIDNRDCQRSSKTTQKLIGVFLVIAIIIIILIIIVSNRKNKLPIEEISNNKTNSETPDVSNKKLTIGKVKELAKKGDTLSWVDFEEYESKDVGSGLLILYYEIDERYHLLIGGSNQYESPWYIKLVVNDEQSNSIDIRTDDIDEFIKNTYKTQYITINSL